MAMESRRSHPNLNYLTLSPITSRLPIDANVSDDDATPTAPTPWTQRASYISEKSAPTTPGILSRSPSRTRLSRASTAKFTDATSKGSKSYTHLAFADTNKAVSGLTKSKSTAALPSQGRRKKNKSVSATPSGPAGLNGEWLNRTGTILWEKSRESKGQSWLVSRDSSTSLVAQDEDDEEAVQHYEPTITSARASRTPSRAPSARTSRRGSRTGSRPDLTFLATPARTPGIGRSYRSGEDYFGSAALNHPALNDPAVFAGPDFVDEEYDVDEYDEDEDDGDEDEEQKLQEDEVRKLTTEPGIGLGAVVDRILGWPLFDLDSATETEEEDTSIGVPKQDVQNNTPRANPQPKSILRNGAGSASSESAQKPGEAQGWSDAAWLLSVASKVLF